MRQLKNEEPLYAHGSLQARRPIESLEMQEQNTGIFFPENPLTD